MFAFNAPDEDVASIRAWMEGFGAEVAAIDFETARQRFDSRVVTFSTYMNVVSGLDQYHHDQWRRVWPSSTGYAFDADGMQCMVSPDRLMAFFAATWRSTGYHPDGTTFDRPGRATFVLIRDQVDRPWRGIHAHYSLNRGVPPLSHGPLERRPLAVY